METAYQTDPARDRGSGDSTGEPTHTTRTVLDALTAASPVWPWYRERKDHQGTGEPAPHGEFVLHGAARAMGAALQPWRTWPGVTELRVGIVADVSAGMAPVADEVGDLARVLIGGLDESVGDDPAWPIRPAVVVADNPPADPPAGRSRGEGGETELQYRLAAGVPVSPSMAEGVAAAADRAHLDRPGDARLLVLITSGHNVRAAAVRDQITALPTGCGVLVISPTAIEDDDDLEDLLHRMGATAAALAGPGAEALLLDTYCPIEGDLIGNRAVAALVTADRTRKPDGPDDEPRQGATGASTAH